MEAKREIRRIDPITKKEKEAYADRVNAIGISADGCRLAWVGQDDRAGIVDLATGKRIAELARIDGGNARIEKVLFSPDGKAVATMGYSDHLQVFNSTTGELISEWDQARGRVIAYSPDGRFIALAEREIVIWDVAARKELFRFAGHRGQVNGIAFEPRGRVLASASEDGTLLVWDLTGRLASAQLPKKALTERELAVAWDDLKSAEPAIAQNAVVAIACGAPESIAFIGKKLSPVEVADPKRIDALVTELDDRDYRIREIASRALAALGEVAEPALQSAFKSESLEVRTRAEALLLTLKKLDDSPDRTRSIRALAALEYAGGPVAKRLLQRYAAGDSGSRQTCHAKATLERIARRDVVK